MAKLANPAHVSPQHRADMSVVREGSDRVGAQSDLGVAGASQFRLLQVRRALFAGATAFLSINLWTGAPLLALWVGSQAAQKQSLSMAAVGVVVVVLAVLTLAMSVALLWLEGRYRRLVGHPLRENRLTWLRPFNAQTEPVRRVPMSMVEHVVTVSVYVAVIALLIWFLFFAGSPLPHG